VQYAQCPVIFVLDGKAGQGGVFNLSRGGCAIESDLGAASGDPISLQITVPNRRQSDSVELGKVRWATRLECGVEFMVVIGDAQEGLDDFLIGMAKEGTSI